MTACTERVQQPFQGYWHDEYYTEDGELVGRTPVRKNQVQNAASTLIAGLLARYDEDAGVTHLGIKYLAVGEGLAAWDAVPPTLSRTDTTLTTEIFRKTILRAEIQFLDALLGSVVVGPTRFLRVQVTLLAGDANGDLREFGLFAGDASGAVDSGMILNWVYHPLVTKTAAMVIVRTIELECLLPV